MTEYQLKQIEVINKIEERIRNNTLDFSTVSPVDDYANDNRISLTSAHIPSKDLKNEIEGKLINPLKNISASHYYYSDECLHMTMKNIRIVNDPPNFNDEDIEKAKKVFTEVIPRHKKFKVYFYRLLLFPMNLSLIGTTDPELDEIILDLDKKLNETGLPDDKKYSNDKYFFSNMTLARFKSPIKDEFKSKVKELSNSLSIAPYVVDSVSLFTCNAVLAKLNIINTWQMG